MRNAISTFIAATVLLCAGTVCGALAGPPQHAKGKAPLLLEAQGSFFVNGEPFFTEQGNSNVPGDTRNPGTATIKQTYVEFQIPQKKHSKIKYPVIMMPGGGHSQKIYESTPDGRDGWATYYVRNGLSVYLSDGVNRGSSSWDLTEVVLVDQGLLPFDAIPAMNRYTHETAWLQLRIGPTLYDPYPGGQFPVEAFQQYTNQLVPAFRQTAVQNPLNIAALVAVIDEVGPCILHMWSQSGPFGIQAALQRPDLVKGLVMIEPAGPLAGVTPEQIAALSHIPILVVDGDNGRTRTNTAALLGDNATSLWLPEDAGITGNSHVMMIEKNNLQIADLILDWMKENVQ
jgi:pimeloyl-ACP methyl ester carboxylesterase